MPLSSEHMQPLTSSTVEFDYCHDRPLRSLATRYALPGQPCPEAPGRTSCCLLLCAGISLRAHLLSSSFRTPTHFRYLYREAGVAAIYQPSLPPRVPA